MERFGTDRVLRTRDENGNENENESDERRTTDDRRIESDGLMTRHHTHINTLHTYVSSARRTARTETC